MSTYYSWERLRQARATLHGARHVPERLCGFLLGALYQVLDLSLTDFKLMVTRLQQIACMCKGSKCPFALSIRAYHDSTTYRRAQKMELKSILKLQPPDEKRRLSVTFHWPS